jgi:hypothetical protein
MLYVVETEQQSLQTNWIFCTTSVCKSGGLVLTAMDSEGQKQHTAANKKSNSTKLMHASMHTLMHACMRIAQLFVITTTDLTTLFLQRRLEQRMFACTTALTHQEASARDNERRICLIEAKQQASPGTTPTACPGPMQHTCMVGGSHGNCLMITRRRSLITGPHW